jgi:hypothetical protein
MGPTWSTRWSAWRPERTAAETWSHYRQWRQEGTRRRLALRWAGTLFCHTVSAVFGGAESRDRGSPSVICPLASYSLGRRTSLWGISATRVRCAYLFFPAHISRYRDRAAEGCRALCRGCAAAGGGRRGWRRAWYARGRAKGSFKAVGGSRGGVWYRSVSAAGWMECGSGGDVGSGGQGRRMSRDGSSKTTGGCVMRQLER